MAISVAVMVGESKSWLPELVEKAKALKLGNGLDKDVDVSPLCYAGLKDRVVELLDSVEKEGGTFLLDGRKYKNP